MRVVTGKIRSDTADTSPALDAVKATLDVEPGWWRRHRTRVGAILGIVGVIAAGGYTVGRVVFSAEAQEAEQKTLVDEVKTIAARLSNIEGQLKILIDRKEP